MRPNATALPLDQKPYLTYAEAAQYLSLPSINALKQRMKRKSIPSWCWTRMGTASVRFIRASLDEWMQPAERRQHDGATAPLRAVRSNPSRPSVPPTTPRGSQPLREPRDFRAGAEVHAADDTTPLQLSGGNRRSR